jgi:hypothetical protein
MASRTVDTEALGQAANALRTYVCEVQDNIRKMQDAATDCADNMGNDVYSQNAISKLQECTTEISKTISQANELMGKILAKKRQIEDSQRAF